MPAFPFEELLCALIKRFPSQTQWAVSCGSALTLHGLDYTPRDLDFFAPCLDAYRIADTLRDLPVVLPFQWRTSEIFASYFGRFYVNAIEVDLVGDFSVKYHGHLSTWDAKHPCWDHLKVIPVMNQVVPVFSLEDLLLVYLALPDEEVKVNKIAHALQTYGYDHAYLGQLMAPVAMLGAEFTTLQL